MIRELGTSAEGTDEYDIVHLLMARGFRVEFVRRMHDLEDAIRAGSPALVCLDGDDDDDDDDYAVVYGFSRRYVRLVDPSWIRSPRTLVTRAVFRKRWAPWRWGLIASRR